MGNRAEFADDGASTVQVGRWSTDSVPHGEREPALGRCLRELFHGNWRIELKAHTPFRAAVVDAQAIRLSLLDVGGRQLRVTREGEGTTALVLVHVQLGGDCVLSVAERSTAIVIPAGSVCVLRMADVTEWRFDEPFRFVALALREDVLDAHFPRWAQSAAQPICCARGAPAILAAHVRQMAERSEVLDHPCARSVASATVELLAATLQSPECGVGASSETPRAAHIERVRCYVRAQLRNPDLDVDQIARGVGLSRRYLHLLFRDESLPLMKWVMRERLEECYRELEFAPRRPGRVSEIAFSWGFNDHAHFTRNFHRCFGFAPRDLASSSARLERAHPCV